MVHRTQKSKLLD